MSEPETTNVDMGGTEDRPPSEEPVDNAPLSVEEDEKMAVDLLGDDDSLFRDDPPSEEDELAPSAGATMYGSAQDEADEVEQEREPTEENVQIEELGQSIEESQADLQETSPIDDGQDITAELEDDDMEQDDEDAQDLIRETIEQVDEVDAGSNDPSAFNNDNTNQREETEERGDEVMSDARLETEDIANGRPSEIPERQVDADVMHGVQDDVNAQSNFEDERIQTGTSFGFQQAHVEEEKAYDFGDERRQTGSGFGAQQAQVEAEQSSDFGDGRVQTGSGFGLQQAQVEDEQPDDQCLFVPELPSRAAQPPSTPTSMAPPPPPLRTPRVAGISTFAKIRNMQKRLAEKKNTANKRSHQSNADPDNEDYLNAVLSSTRPSSSTPAPAVDEDEMAERQAKAEYDKQKRYYDDQRRKHGGELPFRLDVEWMKIKGANDARKKKRARDLLKANEDQEDETDLFPEVGPRFDPEDDQDESSADDGINFVEFGASRKRRRHELPRKESKQISMQEAERQSMLVALEAAGDMPKKKRKGAAAIDDDSQSASTTGKGKGKAPAKQRARASRSKVAPKSNAKGGGRKTAKDKRAVENAVRQATSLFNSNVFEQQVGADEAEQPTFGARKKQDALKEIIASVPIEDKKQARSDMATLLAATKDFDGRGSVKAAGGNWLVKGMRTSLKGYQVLGSAFMRRRENAMEEPKGGLMADQMGLGKTLMMLANIVNGQPRKGHGDRTTLLVASPALLGQWAKEIEQHTDCGLKVMKYGSGNRIDSNAAFEVLKHHDIILTTYSEVMKSYPKNEPPIECQTVDQKMNWWRTTFNEQRGVLHRMKFLRIVLDEGQVIKNYQGRTSIACRALMASHKWALSGTPILNSLTELYPYFKFLGVPHTGSFKIFKHNYCDTNDAENTERLLVRLSQFMIRRTHADRMFNAPILKLPQADQGTFWCDFNPVERAIYEVVRQRFAKNINMWQAKGELDRSYSNALVMLLRLRQLTAHVLMLQFVMRDLLEVEDIENIKDVVKEEAADSSTRRGRTIIAIRKQLEKHTIDQKRKAAAKAEAKAAGREEEEVIEGEGENAAVDDEQPEEDEEMDEPSQHTGQVGAGLGGSGKDFGKEYNFKPFLKSLKTGESWAKAKKKARCSWCSKNPKVPLIASPCGHLICTPCWEEASIAAAEVEKDNAPCKSCGITPTSWLPFEAEQEDEFYDGVATGTRSKAKAKTTWEKRKAKAKAEDISNDWLNMAGTDVLPSAKTMAIKAQILNWRKEDPKVKIIIYTQFLAMVKIMAKIFQMEGWPAEQYIGTMSLPARDKAISTFADNDNVNILLASLRCGGLGLNLTMASRVIMVDPWWNEASEQQAFCRVFRIGQKEETYMSRFCVKNSIDTNLIEMQERKQREIAEVMEDGGKHVKKLSIRDLMRLFGNLNEDEEGKPFILVDNPDPRGGFRADRDDEGYADEF